MRCISLRRIATAHEKSDDEIMNRSDKGKPTAAAEKRSAGENKKPGLKGLERRRKPSRRVDARRNRDARGNVAAGKDNPPVATKQLRNTSLADEAAGQVAELYNELFEIFPTIDAVIIDSNKVGECREVLAAMRQMLNILHRQGERVKLLTELEQQYEADAYQLELRREISETFIEFLGEFTSDCWIESVKQVKATR